MSDMTCSGWIGAKAWLDVYELPQRFPELANCCARWRAYAKDSDAHAREAAARYARYAHRMKVLYGPDWDAILF